jgi:hypothetical protein
MHYLDKPVKYTFTNQPAYYTPMVNAVVDPIIGNHLEYRHVLANQDTFAIWNLSEANEFGRLTQGMGG